MHSLAMDVLTNPPNTFLVSSGWQLAKNGVCNIFDRNRFGQFLKTAVLMLWVRKGRTYWFWDYKAHWES